MLMKQIGSVKIHVPKCREGGRGGDGKAEGTGREGEGVRKKRGKERNVNDQEDKI